VINVIGELARYAERYDSPLVTEKKVIVVEIGRGGKFLGVREEKNVSVLRWRHRSGSTPKAQALCDTGQYVGGLYDDPKKGARAVRCREVFLEYHRELAERHPELPELKEVVCFLENGTRHLAEFSPADRFVFEVEGRLLAGEAVLSLGKALRDDLATSSEDGVTMECAFSGETGPLFRGTLPNFKGPWTATKRKALVTCNRPGIDHGYVLDDAVTNPMSPRVAHLHSLAPTRMVERKQFVRLPATVTLFWTCQEHEIETLLPEVLQGQTPAVELERHRDCEEDLYFLCTGAAYRLSVLHADKRPVRWVVDRVLEIYGPRREEPWDVLLWVTLLYKHPSQKKSSLTQGDACDWMRALVLGDPLLLHASQKLLRDQKGRSPSEDHVRVAACRLNPNL
jgi:hypothetical protein